jgi:hypothetical protein
MPFTGGPSVRVTPNVHFEIGYMADFSGEGKIEIFDNPDGIGQAIATAVTGAPANDHTLSFDVNNTVKADTTYHFRVTHHDPNNNVPDEVSPPPLPPFFTGAQAIGEVFADVDVDSAILSWTANVIGIGRVDYGVASPGEHAASDQVNITAHSLALSGLMPGTAYQFVVSNRHAIDDGSLAEKTGSFTTPLSAPSGNRLTQPSARPRVIYPEDVATLSVRVRDKGKPVPNVLVHFQPVNGTGGGDASTDVTGKATIWMQGVTPGLLRVEVSSPDASNRLVIPVVVRR